MRNQNGVTLPILVIATIIAILISIIIYNVFFGPMGIITMLRDARDVVQASYEGEAETLAEYEEYIDSFLPDEELHVGLTD